MQNQKLPPMTSQQPKRNPADFFKPFARSIPQKRSPPSSIDEATLPKVKTRAQAPKTPVKTVSFKDVTPSAFRSPDRTPRSPSASLPIRSPHLKAVTSPSPIRHTTLFDVPIRSPEKENQPDVSFSFSDTSDRNQKVVKDGELVAVLDSDDDAESLDSLESLEDIFKGRDKAPKPHVRSSQDAIDDLEKERVKMLSLFTGGRSVPIVGKEKLRAFSAKEKALKFDLSVVLDDHFGDQEAEQNIARARAAYESDSEHDEEGKLDTKLLASIVKTENGEDDDEEVARLLNAIERTEALSSADHFSFFASIRPKKAKKRRSLAASFPRIADSHELELLGTSDSISRSWLSGYWTEKARTGTLAGEVIRWAFDCVLDEPQDDLRQIYMTTVKISSDSWTRTNVTALDVSNIFLSLGADPTIIHDGNPIRSRSRPRQDLTETSLQSTIAALNLFQSICQDMDFVALSKLSSINLRLTLDEEAMSVSDVSIAAEALLDSLLNLPDQESRSHVHDRIVSDAIEHIRDPSLQARLLSHIQPTSPNTIRIRKTLADTFLFEHSTSNPKPRTSPATIDELTKLVSTSPSFSLTRHANSKPVNYTTISALTYILDIAISSGISPAPADLTKTTSLSTTTISTPPTPLPLSNQQLKSNTLKPKADPTPESIFNTSIDTLATTIHNLFISIKDTGASHMTRTEAKDALQALYFRLLFSVRTKSRRKKHVFDGNGGAGTGKLRGDGDNEWIRDGKGEDFMKKFLKRV